MELHRPGTGSQLHLVVILSAVTVSGPHAIVECIGPVHRGFSCHRGMRWGAIVPLGGGLKKARLAAENSLRSPGGFFIALPIGNLTFADPGETALRNIFPDKLSD